LPPLKGHPGHVDALVVGEECLLSHDGGGRVLEWPLPDPRNIAKEAKPQAVLWLNSTERAEQCSSVMCKQVCQEPILPRMSCSRHSL
jgi:hypothetical protein